MKTFILTSLLVLFSALSFGQDNDHYKSTLNKLLLVTGSEKSFKGAIVQMTSLFKQQQPEVPAEFWDEFAAEANKDTFNQLVNLLLPVYQKHLSENDLLDVIAFYESPAGKKFAEKAGLITQESMVIGQEWGKQIGEKVVAKLKAKGYMKEEESKQ